MKVILTLSFCLLSLILAACEPILERRNPHKGENDPVLAVSPATTKKPLHPAETALPILPSPTDGDDPRTTSLEKVDLDQLNIPYTLDNPLTDADEILKILDSLAQRHIEWLSRPGWYLYWEHGSDLDVIGEQWVRGTHFINDRGECREQFFFRIRGDQILPIQIRLEDGTEAWLYDQRGPLENAGVDSPEARRLCEMDDAGDVFTLLNLVFVTNRRLEFKESGSLLTYDLRLWKEVVQEKEMVVLYEDVTDAQAPLLRKQDGTWAPVGRNITWTYFDPVSGGPAGRKSEMYSTNGELLHEGWGIRKYGFLAELPPELAQVYEESAAALREFIQNQGQ